GLLAEECDGQIRLHRDPCNGTGIAQNSARNVDACDQFGTRLVPFGACLGRELPDQSGDVALERTIEPGAEERIDDEARSLGDGGRERLDLARPPAGHDGGVTLEAGALAEERQPDRPAPLLQVAGGNEAIAAIVA